MFMWQRLSIKMFCVRTANILDCEYIFMPTVERKKNIMKQ